MNYDIDILDDTKLNIIKSASQVFAEGGFQYGTTRDIAKLAGVNQALINYHFGSKEQLYLYVIRYWLDQAFCDFPFEQLYDSSTPPEDRLYLFVRTILHMLLDSETSPWFGKLFTREATLEHTEATEEMLNDGIAPANNALNAVIRDITSDRSNEEQILLYAASVIGQCTYYYTSMPVIKRMFGIDRLTGEHVKKLSDHITEFSLNAITNGSIIAKGELS